MFNQLILSFWPPSGCDNINSRPKISIFILLSRNSYHLEKTTETEEEVKNEGSTGDLFVLPRSFGGKTFYTLQKSNRICG